MGALSDYLENKLLDHSLGGAPYIPSPIHFLALFTENPGEAGGITAEVVGGGYQRALVTFSAAAGGSKANSNALAFPSMPAASISHAAIFDAPTGGNELYYGQLSSPVAVSDGGTFVVNAGGLVVTLD